TSRGHSRSLRFHLSRSPRYRPQGGTHSRLWIRPSLLRRLRPGPPRSLRLFPRDRDPLPETAISRLASENRVAAHSFLPEPAHIAGRDQIASSRIAVLLDTVSKRTFAICRIKPPSYSMLMSFASSLVIGIPLRWTGTSTGKRFPP